MNDTFTTEWLSGVIPKLSTWKEASLQRTERLSSQNFKDSGMVPWGINVDGLGRLKWQNLCLRTGLWWVHKHVSGFPRSVWFVLGVDYTFVKAAKTQNFKQLVL
jgi:hypothetical protein